MRIRSPPFYTVTSVFRSQGIGEHLFYLQQRRILEAIFTQYATIHPDYVRTAVITLAVDATTVYDQISSRPFYSPNAVSMYSIC